jgi:hypothetical protein
MPYNSSNRRAFINLSSSRVQPMFPAAKLNFSNLSESTVEIVCWRVWSLYCNRRGRSNITCGLSPAEESLKGEQIMAKVNKSTDSSSLAEVVDRILDKGIVIDAWVKVSLVGIELLSVEARIVIASVETYLKYAEAIGLTASAAAPA